MSDDFDDDLEDLSSLIEAVTQAPSWKATTADVVVLAVHTVFQFATALTNSAELILDTAMSHANAVKDEHDFQMDAALEIETLTSPPKE